MEGQWLHAKVVEIGVNVPLQAGGQMPHSLSEGLVPGSASYCAWSPFQGRPPETLAVWYELLLVRSAAVVPSDFRCDRSGPSPSGNQGASGAAWHRQGQRVTSRNAAVCGKDPDASTDSLPSILYPMLGKNCCHARATSFPPQA